ncbi:hypothetical protein F443_23060 [Phytophthora nicotianae P1569]|uniref:Uncharacterized protein n=3 Tax=Phytophthora nicotianae TaxID=4792 RepID=V9DUX2_PHYNI|nr:hypothetical protein F443_23060 [Phytophthora nicotianae P1569]
MYKKELSKMHERVRRYIEISNDMFEKLKDIQQLDYIKAELVKIGGQGKSYRSIIDAPCFKQKIEELFDKPIEEAHAEYDRMLDRRNGLVHPFLMREWKTQNSSK